MNRNRNEKVDLRWWPVKERPPFLLPSRFLQPLGQGFLLPSPFLHAEAEMFLLPQNRISPGNECSEKSVPEREILNSTRIAYGNPCYI